MAQMILGCHFSFWFSESWEVKSDFEALPKGAGYFQFYDQILSSSSIFPQVSFWKLRVVYIGTHISQSSPEKQNH